MNPNDLIVGQFSPGSILVFPFLLAKHALKAFSFEQRLRMSQDFRFDANILFEMLDSDIKCDLLDLHTVFSKSFIHCKAPATKSAWSGEKI